MLSSAAVVEVFSCRRVTRAEGLESDKERIWQKVGKSDHIPGDFGVVRVIVGQFEQSRRFPKLGSFRRFRFERHADTLRFRRRARLECFLQMVDSAAAQTRALKRRVDGEEQDFVNLKSGGRYVSVDERCLQEGR